MLKASPVTVADDHRLLAAVDVFVENPDDVAEQLAEGVGFFCGRSGTVTVSEQVHGHHFVMETGKVLTDVSP